MSEKISNKNKPRKNTTLLFVHEGEQLANYTNETEENRSDEDYHRQGQSK